MRTSPVRMIALLWVSLLLCGSSLAQRPTTPTNTRWRNGDGSERLMVELGGGVNTEAGATRRWEKAGWNYRMGAGYRVNHWVGAMLEYNYDHARIPQRIVDELFTAPGFASPFLHGEGGVHLWSVTVEPTFEYLRTQSFGAYLVGGGGFYRKMTKFSIPIPQCAVGIVLRGAPAGVPKVIDCSLLGDTGTRFLSNNAGGANLGAGFAWRFLYGSNAKLFVEARYVWVENTTSSNNRVYAPANYRTGYFPVTGGLRW